MKEHPILFSTPMVQAILEGRKTMTRRICKMQPGEGEHYEQLDPNEWAYISLGGMSGPYTCPYGKVGDILWVREKWRIISWNWEDGQMMVEYADGKKEWVFYPGSGDEDEWMIKKVEQMVAKDLFKPDEDEEAPFIRTEKPLPWRPSIFMPKDACRIWLEITDIRIERLHDISEDDALAEGIEKLPGFREDACLAYKSYVIDDGGAGIFPYVSFKTLWQKINGASSWDANPWLWVISFKQIQKPE